MRAFCAAFALLFASGTALAADRAEPISLTAKQAAIIQDAVRRELRDPDSAKFGEMVAGRMASGLVVVCGWVNAKNGFGGYMGDMPYLAGIPKNGPAKAGLGDVRTGGMGTFQGCEKLGLPLVSQ